MRIFIYVFLVFFLSGCLSFFEKPQNTKLQDTRSELKEEIPKTITLKQDSGIIKGIVVKKIQEKNNMQWRYEVNATDISNNKLKYASFISSEEKFDKGDIIYAIIKNSILTDSYLIKKNPKKMNLKKDVQYKKIKRKNIGISVPDAQLIKLN